MPSDSLTIVPSAMKDTTQVKKPTSSIESRTQQAIQDLDIALYYGAIYNRNTDTLIPFLTPEEVSRSHNVNIEEVTADGRSIGVPYYSGGSAPTLSLNILVYEDFYGSSLQKNVSGQGEKSESTNKTNISSVDEVLSALRALTYPTYQDGAVQPPECLIMVGKSSQYRARCTGVSDTLSGVTGYTRSEVYDYKLATVSLSFVIIEESRIKGNSQIPSAYDIQERGGNIFG